MESNIGSSVTIPAKDLQGAIPTSDLCGAIQHEWHKGDDTIRDEFAKAAMQAMVDPGRAFTGWEGRDRWACALAIGAYDIADAMMAERERRS